MKPQGVALTALLFTLTAPWGLPGIAAGADPAVDPVFCGAAVERVVPWDASHDVPGDGSATRLYVFSLRSDGASTLSGTVDVSTDTKIYSLTFSDAKFALSPDGGPDLDASSEMFAIPQPDVVRFAWVTDVTDASTGKTVPCATLPVEVKPASADDGAQTSPLSTRLRALDSYHPTLAAYVRDVPPLTCGAAYVPAVVVELPKVTDYWDTSQGRNANPVLMRIDLGTDGKVADVRIEKSSGSVAVNQSAADTAFRGTYKAATFLCSPAAAALYYRYDYSVE